jgi:putative DNA primase/helicase
MEATVKVDKLREMAEDPNLGLLWNPGLGWLHWTGKVWNEVTNSDALHKMNRHLEEQGARSWTARQVIQLRSALEVDASHLDPYPDLLNVPNGVVNLRTGELRPHSKSRLMTKVAAVEYDSEAQSDAWDQVLAAIPETGRTQLQNHIAWAVSGGSLDRAVLIHGAGASGKSTFMRAVSAALGTYAASTHGELSNLRSPFDLIDLRGTRLIAMEDVGPQDMDRVKRLVSMDHFHGRRMRQDTITFPRSHTVLLATNYGPDELTSDEGTRRRISPVEFRNLSETNQELHRRLREPEALRAVLRWIVEGAVRGYATA